MNRLSARVFLSLWVLVFLSAGLLSVPSFAQQGATAIIGEVTDPQGAAVNGAKVTASDAASGVRRTTQTDEQGRFQLLSLQPGTYAIHVEAAGFRTAVTEKIEALVSTTQRVNVKLELGSVSDTVTVTEGAIAPVNTTDATLGNAFDSRQIQALPFEGRDAAGVLSLQPGVTYVGTNVDDNVDTRNGALNGGRSDQANITLDGVDNNPQTTGKAFTGAVRSTLDSIEEFRVTTAGDNADQGRSSGGQVALITRGGTNTFHGALYEQNRPTITAANDWFNKHSQLNAGQPNTPGKIIRNTFGGALGGPIKKDRLFFFGTYEGQRLAENVEQIRNVPSSNLRDGVVLYPCAPKLNASGNVIQSAQQVCPGGSVNGLSGQPTNFPAGTNGLGPAQIAQMDPNCSTPRPNFPNGTCPAGPGVNLAAASVFQKYPAPNSSNCGNNDGFNISCFNFSAANPQNLNTTIAKIDYNITRSGSHRLFVRANYQTDRDALPAQLPGQPASNVIRDTSRSIAVGYTAVLSNSVVNSFHYGLTRQSQDNLGIEKAGIVTFRYFDDLFPGTSTLSPLTAFTTQFHIPVHNWVDDVTWTKGKHTLQFGTNVRFINNVRASDSTNFNYASTNPVWLAASPAGSGGSLDPGAFGFVPVDPNNASPYDNGIINLVGLIPEVVGGFNRTTGSQNGGAPQPIPEGALVHKQFRSWEYEWYAQDAWHLTPNLTVTAGLRYTILEPPYETNGNQVGTNASLNQYVNSRAALMQQGLSSQQIISYAPSGQANGKQPFWPYDYKDLGPRISVAYAPNPSGGLLRALFGGGGKSSIRAGYGLVYDHFGTTLVNTFDEFGSFGLNTQVVNAASVQTVDGSVRFTGLNDIPTHSPDGTLLTPAPSGAFPYTPPVSTVGNNLQQISFGLDDKLRTPYSELVDVSFTRELPGGLVFEASYVGRFAHRLLQQRDLAMPLNLKDPKSGSDYFTAATQLAKLANNHTPVDQVPNLAYFQNLFAGAAGVNGSYCGDGLIGSNGARDSGAPNNGNIANPSATQSMYEMFYCNWGVGTFGASNFINVFDANCFPACASINGTPTPYAFYNPEFSALYAWSSMGKSSYNAGQFVLRSRPVHGLQFDFNYVLSKSLDVGSDSERVTEFGGLSAVINTWSPNQLRGVSDFDARHQVNANWVYDLPVGRGKAFGRDLNTPLDTILGGWQVSGIYRWTSGFPFTIPIGQTWNTNFQLSGDAVLTGPLKTGLNFVTNPALGLHGDPFAFEVGNNPANAANSLRLPYPGESGMRDGFRGQGFFGIDMGVNKTFRFTERHTLRFSAYAYNLTNSVRFDPATITFNGALTNPNTLGQYSGTTTKPRVMEFALRYQF